MCFREAFSQTNDFVLGSFSANTTSCLCVTHSEQERDRMRFFHHVSHFILNADITTLRSMPYYKLVVNIKSLPAVLMNIN